MVSRNRRGREGGRSPGRGGKGRLLAGLLLGVHLGPAARGQAGAAALVFRASPRISTWRVAQSLGLPGRASESPGALLRARATLPPELEADLAQLSRSGLDPDAVTRSLEACGSGPGAAHLDRPESWRDCLPGELREETRETLARTLASLDPLVERALRVPAARDLGELLRRRRGEPVQRGLREGLERIRAVLDVPPGGPVLRVELVGLPRLEGVALRSLRSQSLGPLQVVEVLLPTDPLRDLDVLVHEASHALFRRSRSFPAVLDALPRLDPERGPLLADQLLEEALATVFGVEVARDLGLEPGASWYQDPHIDPLARRLAPAVRSYLGRGRPLDPFLVRHALGLFSRLWPRARERVDMAFQGVTLVTGGLDPFPGMSLLQRHLGARSLWLAPLGEPTAWPPDPGAHQGSLACFLTPPEARARGLDASPRVEAWLPGEGTGARGDPCLAGGGRARVLVVAPDLGGAGRLLGWLAGQEHLPLRRALSELQPGASTRAE